MDIDIVKPEADDMSKPIADMDYEPNALLSELKDKAQQPRPDHLPTSLPLQAIKPLPDLFQPRGTDERHIQELVRAIRNQGTLDPILVMQIGDTAYLLDGHHRLDAYHLAKVDHPVPVSTLRGRSRRPSLKQDAQTARQSYQ